MRVARRGLVIALVAGWLGGGWLGGAQAAPEPPPGQPAASKPAGATATPAAEGPDAALFRRVVRAIKRAEREGFERHVLERHLALFTPDATVTFGRLPQPDAHDVRFDRAMLEAVLAQRYRRPPTGREQVFFFDVETRREGPALVVEARLARRLFGGREELGRRYTLVETAEGWRVKALRSWPLVTSHGGVPTDHSPEAWKIADEAAAAAMADEGVDLDGKLSALIQARWLPKAYALTRQATEARPDDVQRWLTRAHVALEVGQVDDARAAMKRAKALDPALAVPASLQ